MNTKTARDTILAGVTTLADPTQPGQMVVYGDNAYSITICNHHPTRYLMPSRLNAPELDVH
ncbi:MAG: hypothetical protein HRT88_17745 [Lentisphaeraceae bacterium]|nr:hypothetical protein [Lentisphaeraceae bacterium]